VVKRVGQVTFVVDAGLALPGGFFLVRLQPARGLGSAYAILDGRRAPFYSGPKGSRAIVPVPVGSASGPNIIGIEILTRRGRQRIPLDVSIGQRPYPPRLVVLPEARRALLKLPSATHDGRVLLALLRTETEALGALGPLKPPVSALGMAFGSLQTYEGGAGVEALVDSAYGEYHRGLDFGVAQGTPVLAPATGSVLFAGPLALSGQTVVIDHGQGLVSALFHLSRVDVAVGDRLDPQSPVGLSGDTGLCDGPKLEWRVYAHGIAIDPRLLNRSLD
jgi:hypothetical protein